MLLPCLVAPVLYAGPLYISYLSESLLPWQQHWGIHNFLPNAAPGSAGLQAIRNYVLVRQTPYIPSCASLKSV